MAHDIALLFQQCDPSESLPPGDKRYVTCEGVRGNDVVMELAKVIGYSKKTVCRLLTGHRGGGKSTELRRLQQELEHPSYAGRKFFVVYFEADEEDIDVNDVDFPDLLLAIVRQVGFALRCRLSIELTPSWWVKFIDGLKGLLGSELEFDKLALDVKIAKLTATIKNSPKARDEIRKALEPNTSNLIKAANDFIAEANLRLRDQGQGSLVVIVDNLDRIVLRDLDPRRTTHDHLFLHRGPQLKALDCHLVYTLPITMVFLPQAGALTNVFDSQPYVIPMIKVIHPDGSDNPAGLKAMREVVLKRLARANITEGDAFDTLGTLDDLCRKSGGHLRNLLILLQSACISTGNLPLKQSDVAKAFGEMENGFERSLIRPSIFETLRQIDLTHELSGGEHDSILLYNLSVLEYMNGRVWYAVNPAVRNLAKFIRNPP